jgi:hypothetical protein
LAAAKTADCGVTCLCIAALSFDQPGQLISQKRRNRETALRGKHASFAQGLLVEGERDVASRGHRYYV